MPEDREMIKNGVLVGVDGSGAGTIALDWAARAAARLGRPLTICHVSPGTEQLGILVFPDLAKEFAERGRKIVERAAARAKEARPDLAVEIRQLSGQPAATLRDAAGEGSILVVGRHGTERIRSFVRGSVSTQVAAHAPCTVVVTKESPAPTSGPIVVGVDDTSQMTAALEFAFTMASAAGVELVAIHAVDVPGPVTAPRTPPIDEYITRARVAAEELVDDQITPWMRKFPDVPVRQEILDGQPSDSLIELSKAAQLVVVGSRGRGGFTGLLLGSTSRPVVALAECPVAVTH